MKKILLTGVLAFFGLGYGYSVPVETEGSVVLAQTSVRYVEVRENNINIRKAPRTGAVIQKAKMGQTFRLISTVNGWHKIRLNNGTIGYVSASRNLTSVTDVQRIPSDLLSYFEAAGNYSYEDLGECHVETCILERGPYVYVSMSASKGDDFSQIDYYLGTVQHNRIVCTKRKVTKQSPYIQLDTLNPSDFQNMKPGESFILDYSPYEYTYYYKGQRIASFDMDYDIEYD